LCDPEVQLGHTGGLFNRSEWELDYSKKYKKLRAKYVICGRKQIWFCPGCEGAYMCEGACYLKVHMISK